MHLCMCVWSVCVCVRWHMYVCVLARVYCCLFMITCLYIWGSLCSCGAPPLVSLSYRVSNVVHDRSYFQLNYLLSLVPRRCCCTTVASHPS